jgi:predicted peptidase
MLKIVMRFSFLLFLLFPAAGNAHSENMAERFEAGIFQSTSHSSLPYRLLIPKYDRRTVRYPLVLFLHGSDERGTDNAKQLFVGLNIFADEKKMNEYPCFIAAPQCPADMKWTDTDWKAERHVISPEPTPALAMSIELIAALLKQYPVDDKRIYIVGYSMGGFGAWEAIERWPKLFAAAVPVCGGGDESKAYRIIDIPIWAFHGARDRIVRVGQSQNMVHAVVRAGGVPRYTEYPMVNHYCWGLAFSDPRMFEWLFRQKK